MICTHITHIMHIMHITRVRTAFAKEGALAGGKQGHKG